MVKILLISCLLLCLSGYSQNWSVSGGGSAILGDLGGRDGRKGSFGPFDINREAWAWYGSARLSKNGNWVMASVISGKGADSLTGRTGDSYYRWRRERAFENLIIEISAGKEIRILNGYVLAGAGVFYHSFAPRVQPVVLIAGGVPVNSGSVSVSAEVTWRITATDVLDGFPDNEWSNAWDQLLTAGVNIRYQKRNNYLKCPKLIY